MKRLHDIAEYCDWYELPPKRFWRWLLHKLDIKAGFLECVPPTYERVVEKYFELIYAVERKFPNETRHDTALRYIRETEKREQFGGETVSTKNEYTHKKGEPPDTVAGGTSKQ